MVVLFYEMSSMSSPQVFYILKKIEEQIKKPNYYFMEIVPPFSINYNIKITDVPYILLFRKGRKMFVHGTTAIDTGKGIKREIMKVFRGYYV